MVGARELELRHFMPTDLVVSCSELRSGTPFDEPESSNILPDGAVGASNVECRPRCTR